MASNIKAAPAISAATASRIVAWLDAHRQGPAPVEPCERVQVYTLQDMTIVFIGDRDAAIFDEERNG